MSDKRYQVFISSTFEDLKVERRAVQDVIINTGDFPVQMESFPAADEDQFGFIKSLINNCDYYVLIIAGKYGTVADDGMSYTEKEYRYAVSKKIPILVMLHGDRGKISADKTESTETGRELLESFIREVETNRIRKTWTTLDGLKLAVREALDNAKATKPRIGWVRGNTAASFETLEELNELRKENSEFKKTLGELEFQLPMPPIPAADETLLIDLLSHSTVQSGKIRTGSNASVRTTWISVFPIFHSCLEWESSDFGNDHSYWINSNGSSVKIGSTIAGEIESIDTDECFKISDGALNRLINYYIEAGLMFPIGNDVPFTQAAEKYARRFSILNESKRSFEVEKGEISIAISTRSIDFDEDIPF